MAQKDNTFLLIALGIGGFIMYKKGLFGGGTKKRGSVYVDSSQIVPPGSEEWANTPDAIIDTEKQRLTIPDAINMARDVLDQAKDALVVVRTKNKNLALRKGTKKVKPNSKIKTFKFQGKKLKAKKARKIFSAENTAQYNFGL